MSKGEVNMSDYAVSSIVASADSHEDKKLTFVVAGVTYGIDISFVRQIRFGVSKITRIPQQPVYVKGVVNLRGQIVPIIDMHLRFNKPPVEYHDRTCAIILNIDNIVVGIIVDAVTEVINISEKDIAVVPEFDQGIKQDFVKGIAKINENVIIILEAYEIIKHDKETYNNVVSKK
jgi:purine-binding chemotaxis protein CheW